MQTRNQRWAHLAYTNVSSVKGKECEAEYKRFSKKFPALISSCGLAQAMAFAEVKAPKDYCMHLALVMERESFPNVALHARTDEVSEYQLLSRQTIAASSWIKRYAEAILEG